LPSYLFASLGEPDGDQVQGNGSRIKAEQLREAMQKSRSLHNVLLKFVHAFMILTAHTALSNGTATVEERLDWVNPFAAPVNQSQACPPACAFFF
jgi:hypothetical protein